MSLALFKALFYACSLSEYVHLLVVLYVLITSKVDIKKIHSMIDLLLTQTDEMVRNCWHHVETI